MPALEAPAPAAPSPSPIPTLAVRIDSENPLHHLWNNHGTWWVHCTIHGPDFTSERIRRSLKTQDLEVARKRRDAFFLQLEGGAQ